MLYNVENACGKIALVNAENIQMVGIEMAKSFKELDVSKILNILLQDTLIYSDVTKEKEVIPALDLFEDEDFKTILDFMNFAGKLEEFVEFMQDFRNFVEVLDKEGALEGLSECLEEA